MRDVVGVAGTSIQYSRCGSIRRRLLGHRRPSSNEEVTSGRRIVDQLNFAINMILLKFFLVPLISHSQCPPPPDQPHLYFPTSPLCVCVPFLEPFALSCSPLSLRSFRFLSVPSVYLMVSFYCCPLIYALPILISLRYTVAIGRPPLSL